MDALWADGWRHFGPLFFRYDVTESPAGELLHIIPLRVDVTRFAPSKSQRRTLRRCADLRFELASVRLDDERHVLFDAHAARFNDNVPGSLEDFLGGGPQWDCPCPVRELSVRDADGHLLAASYVDLGAESTSAVYAMWDPPEAHRRLGIATMLWEIEHARRTGRRWHYLGYASREPSHYDYKRDFGALEWFDWTEWRPDPPPGGDSI